MDTKIPSFMKKQHRKQGQTWLPPQKNGIIQGLPTLLASTLWRADEKKGLPMQWFHNSTLHNWIEYYIEIIDQYCMELQVEDESTGWPWIMPFFKGVNHVWPRFPWQFFHKNVKFLCPFERKKPEFCKTHPTFVFSPLLVPSMAH